MKKNTKDYTCDSWDRNDCAVRALMVAIEIPYAVANQIYKMLGRQTGKGTPRNMSRELLETKLKKVPLRVEGWSLRDFCIVEAEGSFVVMKRKHAFAVKEGIVQDWETTTAPSTRLEMAWRVTEETRKIAARLGKILEESEK